eukprot:9609073-Lingulodinium_polyedra.AAC.1
MWDLSSTDVAKLAELAELADLDWLCNYLHLPHFNSSATPAMLCRANRTDRPWTDMRHCAAFARTVLRGAELRVDCHPLFQSP